MGRKLLTILGISAVTIIGALLIYYVGGRIMEEFKPQKINYTLIDKTLENLTATYQGK